MVRKHIIFYGSVVMEIQGEEENIDQVIMAIERGTYVRIENMESRTIPIDEHEHGFYTKLHKMFSGMKLFQ